MDEYQKVVLVLEDDPDISNLLGLLISRAPAQLVTAHHPKEARVLLESARPDLLLLDLMLPEVDGLDFLSDLRADARYIDLPVIVITVRTDTEHRRRARELGVLRYLVKPFSPAILREEIQAALHVDWSSYW